MKLRHIILDDYEVDCKNNDLVLRYQRESWCISQFLTRHVRKQKIESGRFNSIVITPVGTRAIKAPWQAEDNLNVDVPFDWAAYKGSRNPNEIQELFCNLISEGYERLRNDWNLPIDQLQDILAGFREGGFVNEWNFKRRLFRDYGLKASLDCKIDLKHFTLTLTITKGKDVLFNDVVLEAEPDPLAWYYRFEDVIAADGRVIIPTRKYYPSGQVPLDEALFHWEIPKA